MTTLSPDTTPEAEQVQIELLRTASTARRFQAARVLSATAIALAVRGIRATMPEADDQMVLLRFVSVHHGEELARALARYLDRMNS